VNGPVSSPPSEPVNGPVGVGLVGVGLVGAAEAGAGLVGAGLVGAAEAGPVGVGFCDQCGKPVAGSDHERCAARRALEPPRYCSDCARRMVVQVTPTGWTARCSRHGERRS